MAWDRKVPFDKDGNLQHYPGPHYTYQGPGVPSLREDPNWVGVYEFKALLRYVGYVRGRSAAYFIFEDTVSKKQYPMFMTELDKIIWVMKNGLVDGSWTFEKRGQNFGIKLVDSATHS